MFSCRQLLFSKLFYCLPVAAFFEAVLLPAVSKKVVFLGDFRRHVREFFNVVFVLARPSEPWRFPAGSCRQQNLSKKVVFLGLQTGRLAVFPHGFGTSSSCRAMVFSCQKVICRSCLIASSRRQPNLSKKLFYCQQS